MKIFRLLTPLLLTIVAVFCFAPAAWAFCGFYVAKADTKLYNKASQVVIARNGDRTVLTMANDFQGEVKDFAIVVPVPTVLQKEQVRVTEPKIMERLDAFSAPRLVEYFDPDPCASLPIFSGNTINFSAAARGDSLEVQKTDRSLGVTVEARFNVGEYDIVILSAKESQDALQQTWLYFCRNVCEGLTGQTYDPSCGSVITWLNAYLKRRLQDFYINQNREQSTTVPLRVRQSISGGIREPIDPVDNLPAMPQAPPILEELEIWAKTDSEGELCGTYIKGRPDVNCQVLILKRLPPEVSWKELSEEFGLSIPTLSSFYQRQCLPRLRKFAEFEGLL